MPPPGRYSFTDAQRRPAFFAAGLVVVCFVVVFGVLNRGGSHTAARSTTTNAASTRPAGHAPRIVGAISTQSATETATTSTSKPATHTSTTATATAGSSGSRTLVSTPPGFQAQCHYQTYPDGAIVPDPSCTPGVLDPAAVANPRNTICTPGYSARHQPPQRYTEPLLITDMEKYSSTGPPSTYQLDQLVPVEDGGSARNPKNLWPEYLWGNGGALQKDKAENRVHALICSGKITVQQGASLLEGDWMQVLSASSAAKH